MARVRYTDIDVLAAARERVRRVFDEVENVWVSVSGGKDSTVLRHLALQEAERRGRRITLFFLDQEAELQSTIDLVREWMRSPATDPAWYQVPIRMTNATSHREYFLHAWGPGERWIREKDPIAIHEAPGAPDRFYPFFEWVEGRVERPTAFLVGLRSRESFDRFRAVTKQAGRRDWAWTTKTASPLAFRAYPLYDWTDGDVWKYIADHGLTYNRYYDRMYAKYGDSPARMRVSYLMHEKSFRGLVDLQEFEPETYERLVSRLGGVHYAALYAEEDLLMAVRELPAGFGSWRAYRDYLLATTPIDRIDRFRKRFAGQPEAEEVFRQQCRQILANDWEGSLPVHKPKLLRQRELWWNRL
ncbi:MAG TPA: phosphoadenosine phosphosulfate reductase family protein [Longimicrobiales bacterium]